MESQVCLTQHDHDDVPAVPGAMELELDVIYVASPLLSRIDRHGLGPRGPPGGGGGWHYHILIGSMCPSIDPPFSEAPQEGGGVVALPYIDRQHVPIHWPPFFNPLAIPMTTLLATLAHLLSQWPPFFRLGPLAIPITPFLCKHHRQHIYNIMSWSLILDLLILLI